MKKSIFELSKKKLKRVEKAYKRTAFGKLTERSITLTFSLILLVWLCELVFNKLCNKQLQLNEIDFTGLFIALVTYVVCRLIQLKFIKDFYNEKYIQRKPYDRYFSKTNNERNTKEKEIKKNKQSKKWY